jgi:hypothetical protein
MPITQFACPGCKAVLKPAKPVPDGSKIKCPKCAKVFVPSALATKAGPAQKPAEDDGPDFELVEDDGPDFEVVEDEDPKPQKRKADRDDEALASKPKSKAPAPAGKRRRDEEDEEEEDDRPAKGRRSRDDDEDDDRPAKRHKARDEEDEDEDRPAKRRRSRDDDDDDEEDRERPAKRGKARDDYDDDDDDDYDEDDDDRPAKGSKHSKKKKSGSKLFLILGIVGGSVLFLGLIGGGLGYWIWNKPVIPSSEWTEFAPEGGRFSILMPGSPQKGATAAGEYVVKRDREEMEFGVAVIDLPSKEAAAFFDTFKDLKGKSDSKGKLEQDGKVTMEKDITLDGNTGREFHAEGTKKGNVACRIYLAKKGTVDATNIRTMSRIYILLVEGKGVKPGRKDAAKFFDSFKIK